jgi:hypothetical protein
MPNPEVGPVMMYALLNTVFEFSIFLFFYTAKFNIKKSAKFLVKSKVIVLRSPNVGY